MERRLSKPRQGLRYFLTCHLELFCLTSAFLLSKRAILRKCFFERQRWMAQLSTELWFHKFGTGIQTFIQHSRQSYTIYFSTWGCCWVWKDKFRKTKRRHRVARAEGDCRLPDSVPSAVHPDKLFFKKKKNNQPTVTDLTPVNNLLL